MANEDSNRTAPISDIPFMTTYTEADLVAKARQEQEGNAPTRLTGEEAPLLTTPAGTAPPRELEPQPTQQRNIFEERQAARRERYEERADRARRESAAASDQARRMASVIPFGQPILVGHHSEKRDRNYRARIGRKMDQSIELSRKASYYESKAEAVGDGGISSDDPAAIDKLRGELAQLEQRHALMIATNSAHKRYLKDPASLDRAELPDSVKEQIRNYKPAYSWEPHPIPPYRLTNNGANIRRIKARIAELQRRPTESTESQVQMGTPLNVSAGINGTPASGSFEPAADRNDTALVTVREDVDENRVMLIFPGKPSEEVRKIMKASAFKWSPSRGAWVRFLNNAGRDAAQYVISRIADHAKA